MRTRQADRKEDASDGSGKSSADTGESEIDRALVSFETKHALSAFVRTDGCGLREMRARQADRKEGPSAGSSMPSADKREDEGDRAHVSFAPMHAERVYTY